MTTLETFTVSGGSSHADAARTCRLLLRTVQGSVARYETDIPVASADWPPEVASAARVLRGVAARTGRVEPGGYSQTGVITYADDQVWSAFVDFAPRAYDATVWNAAGDDIVSLSDEAQSIVIRINHQQYDAIAAALGPQLTAEGR
ncbi:hypothetical protein ACQPYH_00125 [Kribbella sp. CA-245084]|uniref:hypothetical protein n=1 Tax=Kribbella sp. CA-245084 TaxID=3239940 RepID=UPI003D8E72A5